MNDNKNMPPIYVVSGGKGVAGHTIVETMLIQYPDNKIPVIVIPEIKSLEQVDEVTDQVVAANGAIAHTMVNHEMRRILIEACEQKKYSSIRSCWRYI